MKEKPTLARVIHRYPCYTSFDYSCDLVVAECTACAGTFSHAIHYTQDGKSGLFDYCPHCGRKLKY